MLLSVLVLALCAGQPTQAAAKACKIYPPSASHNLTLACNKPSDWYASGQQANQREVKRISLNNQNFTSITKAQLSRFPKLEYFEIKDSARFMKMESDTFQGNAHLKKVVIGDSNMTRVSWLWLRHSVHFGESIPVFDLSDAPLLCSCANAWVYRWMDESSSSLKVKIDQKNWDKVQPPLAAYLRLPKIVTSQCVGGGGKVPWETKKNDFDKCGRVEISITPESLVLQRNNISGVAHLSYEIRKFGGGHNYNMSIGIKDISHSSVHQVNYTRPMPVPRHKPGMMREHLSTTFLGQMEVNFDFRNFSIPEIWVSIEFEEVTRTKNSTLAVEKFPLGPFINMSVIFLETKPRILLRETFTRNPTSGQAIFVAEITSFPRLNNMTCSDYRPYGLVEPFRAVHLPSDCKCKPDYVHCSRVKTDAYTKQTFIVSVSARRDETILVVACNTVGCSESPITLKLRDHLERHANQELAQTYEFHPFYREVWLLAALGTFGIALIAVGLGVGMKTMRDRLRPNPPHHLRESMPIAIQTEQMVNLSPNPSYSQLPVDIRCIPEDDVELLDQIGEGAFGVVFEAVWYPEASKSGTRVAAKGLKSSAVKKEREEFEREAVIMNKLKHDNIIKLIGVCPGPNFLLIFEFMDQGDLKSFLMLRGPNRCYASAEASYQNMLTTKELLDIGYQLAMAMAFLAKNHFVHRDVAARNCLVSDPLKVKLGDFGLSRDIYVAQYYKLSRDALLPVRWLAPESVSHGRFTVESDIWSFGILLWEIFSYGELPWSDLDSTTVLKSVKCGDKLHSPRSCPYPVYELMLCCWKMEPARRMRMSDLTNALQVMRNKY